MKTRYSFGGDEHLVAEVDEEMSLEAFFKVLLVTNMVREKAVAGVMEVCPANASYMVKFDPDVIEPPEMLNQLQEIEQSAGTAEQSINTRVVELPVYYNDPWTRETLLRFATATRTLIPRTLSTRRVLTVLKISTGLLTPMPARPGSYR